MLQLGHDKRARDIPRSTYGEPSLQFELRSRLASSFRLATDYRKIADGTFPSQVKISVHGAGWRESAVNRWIADPVGYREDTA